MADNVNITAGAGTAIKTDQGGVSGGHMQVVKLAISSDGGEDFIPADTTYGMDVDVTRSVLPTGAATEVTLAGIKTGTDKIPAAPAQEHVAAASPHAARLSDGASFYDGAKTGQFPAALVGGRLDVNVGASATINVADGAGSLTVDDGSTTLSVDDGGGALTVDGTVTANQGTAAAAASAWPVKISDATDTVGISTVGGAKALKVDVVQSAALSVSVTDRTAARVTKQVTYAASQTAEVLWTPGAGNKFCIESLFIATTDAGAGYLTIFDHTDSAANVVWKGKLGNYAHVEIVFNRPWKSSTDDNVLKYTTGAGAVGDISVHGFEE